VDLEESERKRSWQNLGNNSAVVWRGYSKFLTLLSYQLKYPEHEAGFLNTALNERQNLYIYLFRALFGRGFGPVVRQTTKLINTYSDREKGNTRCILGVSFSNLPTGVEKRREKLRARSPGSLAVFETLTFRIRGRSFNQYTSTLCHNPESGLNNFVAVT
jgi:hypothetical protein